MAFNFKHRIGEFKKMKRTLPLKVANVAKNHYLDSFRKGGFTDASFDPWEARKTRNRSDRRTRKRRAILVDTGFMRGSIRIGSATWSRIEVGAYGVPYAKYHNNAEEARVHRKFLGRSQVVSNKVRTMIRREMKDVL